MATTTWPAEVYVFDGTHWVSISPHGMTTLPPATGTTIGGVIVGSGVNVAPDGTISVTHFSGDYNDLTNKPVIQAPVQSDWLATGGDAFIVNKPNFLSQFTNDLKVSAFPNDALYVDAAAAAAAAPIQSIAAGANVAITDDGHGNIVIAATGGGGGTPGGGVVSVSGTAPIKVVDGLNAPVISLVLGAGLKVNSGALEADVPDASTTTKGIIQIADAAAITAGTALRAVDAAGLKAVTDQQAKDFVNVAGDTMTGALVIPDGTAAAPSLKFDDGAGIFQPATDTVAISTAGVERVRCQGDTVDLRNKKMFFNTQVTVPAGAGTAFPSEAIKLNDTHDTTLSKGWLYQVNLTTRQTANRTGSRYLVYWDEANSTWVARAVGVSDASVTNTPHLLVDNTNSNIKAYNEYTGASYATYVRIEATYKSQNQGSAHPAGSDFHWQRDGDKLFYTDGNVGINNASPASALDVNGVITVSPGTASAPSVCASGDGDSGLWFPGANTVALSTAGLERVRVRADGNVGIGTSGASNILIDEKTSHAFISRHESENPADGTGLYGGRFGERWQSSQGPAPFFIELVVDPLGSSYGFGSSNSGGSLPIIGGTSRCDILVNLSQSIEVKLPLHTVPGSAAAPAIVASGDADTGVWFPGGNNTVAISTAGVERLRVEADGRMSFGAGGSGSANGIQLNRSLSGGSGVNGVISAQTVLSDVTSGANVFRTFVGTEAASFTLGFLTHFRSSAGTFGSGSTVTTQIGFHADITLTEGTNNYGFRGDIEDGSGRWNFYAHGTAPNYFNGNVGIGRTDPASALDVSGVITVSPGTAAAPALCISGDSNTGVFQASAAPDTLSISTGGSERLRVKSTGGVKYVPLATAPATPEEGEVYFDSTTKKLRVYDGTAWADLH